MLTLDRHRHRHCAHRAPLLATLVLVLVLRRVVHSAAAAASSVNLYVAPSGRDDTHDGSLERPFQTLARAKQEVAAQQRVPANAGRPINVFLRAGRYALTETLEFGPTDSGLSPDAPVTYQAYCDATAEAAATSVLAFPYRANLAVSAPRRLWNGVGDPAAWTGPVDPFAQMGINKTANALLTAPLAPRPIKDMDISSVCVDKHNVGHTCYGDPLLAPCVTGCMAACAAHVARKVYADAFYRKFTHLFGKDLAKEDDCVEVCTQSCRGCERVTLSGSVLIPAGAITTWTLVRTVATSGQPAQRLSVFRADLAPFLPAPVSPDTSFSFATLYVDDVQHPRAGFPDCSVPTSPRAHHALNCSYAAATSVRRASKTVMFDPKAFAPQASQWTNAQAMVLELRPNRSDASANLFYSVRALDATNGQVVLGAGGSELSSDVFVHGPPDVPVSVSSSANGASFRVENVLEALDAPGEWFFDPATKMLFLIPLDGATATVATLARKTLEIPVLRQLVRVSGSRENTYTAAAHASSSLIETDSRTATAHLRFRHLVFSGTELRHTDVYERVPGSSWPMARIAAIFLETVEDVAVEHCTFEKIGGNALMVSGESDRVRLVHNNVSFVGANAIAVLARLGAQRNAHREPVLAHLLFARETNISFNQVHHVGQRVAHAAAIMSAGAYQTTIDRNLVFAVAGASYHVTNANGASVSDGAPLIRPIAPIAIPETLAPDLASTYTTAVAVTGLDIPVIAKLVGAPPCLSGSGRTDALYGDPDPFTYTSCSGCCSVHANSAKLRIQGAGVTWTDASARAVVLRPGDTLELAVTSSAFFNSVIDVYVGFHVVTPNQVLELSTRARWQVRTRACQYAERTYTATCSGPCASESACGNSNIAVQQNGKGLTCAAGYEADVTSHVCSGPFEAWRDCDGSGVLRSHVYYDCSITCFTTSCV